MLSQRAYSSTGSGILSNMPGVGVLCAFGGDVVSPLLLPSQVLLLGRIAVVAA
jgi:hypothetical protein